jgi:hypothetical protein
MAGYFDELTRAREMLHSRYDDLKSGRAKAISRDELVAHFRDKSTTARHTVRRMITYDFHPEVRHDLDEIWDVIGADNIEAADRLIAEIVDAIGALVPFPASGTRAPTSLDAACALIFVQ